jgi:hypothetical protein
MAITVEKMQREVIADRPFVILSVKLADTFIKSKRASGPPE